MSEERKLMDELTRLQGTAQEIAALLTGADNLLEGLLDEMPANYIYAQELIQMALSKASSMS